MSDDSLSFPLTYSELLVHDYTPSPYSVIKIPWSDIKNKSDYLSIHLLDCDKISADREDSSTLVGQTFNTTEDFMDWYLSTSYVIGIVGLFSGTYGDNTTNPFPDFSDMWVEDPSVLNKRWASFEFVQ